MSPTDQLERVDLIVSKYATEPVGPAKTEIVKPKETREDREEILADLNVQKILDACVSTKLDIIEWVSEKMKDEDVDELEIREVKDLASIVKQVEEATVPKVVNDDKPVINVLVQNLMEAKDDC